MIKADNGRIEMQGELTELTSDAIGILHGYLEAVTGQFDEDSAKKLFALVGRIASLPRPSEASEEELEQILQYADDYSDIVHEAVMKKRIGGK